MIVWNVFTLQLSVGGENKLFSIVRTCSNANRRGLKFVLAYGSCIVFANNFVMGLMINQTYITWKIIVLVEFTNLLFQFKNILAEGKLTCNNIRFSSFIICMTSGNMGWNQTMNWTLTLGQIGVKLNDRWASWYICFNFMTN